MLELISYLSIHPSLDGAQEISLTRAFRFSRRRCRTTAAASSELKRERKKLKI
jgi:hypothetical protein